MRHAPPTGSRSAPGPHEVQTQPGFPPGVDVDIDSVVLDSAPGGAALADDAVGARPADRVGCGPGADRRPLLGHLGHRSWCTTRRARSGWCSARAPTRDGTPPRPGDRTSGPPQLIDGYANGWLVTPVDARAAPW